MILLQRENRQDDSLKTTTWGLERQLSGSEHVFFLQMTEVQFPAPASGGSPVPVTPFAGELMPSGFRI